MTVYLFQLSYNSICHERKLIMETVRGGKLIVSFVGSCRMLLDVTQITLKKGIYSEKMYHGIEDDRFFEILVYNDKRIILLNR